MYCGRNRWGGFVFRSDSDPLHTRAEIEALVRALVPQIVAECLAQQSTRPPLLDINGVAERLNVCPRTVDTLLAAGELPPPIRVGRLRRWDAETVEAHLRRTGRRGGTR